MGEETEEVQFNLSSQELKLLQSLARGKSDTAWVSEQDALSSYWINVLRLCGERVEAVVNSVNVGTSRKRVIAHCIPPLTCFVDYPVPQAVPKSPGLSPKLANARGQRRAAALHPVAADRRISNLT